MLCIVSASVSFWFAYSLCSRLGSTSSTRSGSGTSSGTAITNTVVGGSGSGSCTAVIAANRGDSLGGVRSATLSHV